MNWNAFTNDLKPVNRGMAHDMIVQSYSWQRRSSTTRFKLAAKFLTFETYWGFERHGIDEAQRQRTAAAAKFPPTEIEATFTIKAEGTVSFTGDDTSWLPTSSPEATSTHAAIYAGDGRHDYINDLFGRDSTPFRGRRDSSERETSPNNKLVWPKAPETQLMHSNLEKAGETTRAKTQSPTATTSPSMTNPAGSTTTIPTPLAPAKSTPAKFPPTHLPIPQGAAGSSTRKPYMVNSNAGPWNDEPPEEIVTEGVCLQQAEASSTWMSEWERAELNLPNNTAPAAEAKPPPAKVPAWLAVRSNNSMALGQPNVDVPPRASPPPGQRPNSYYMAW